MKWHLLLIFILPMSFNVSGQQWEPQTSNTSEDLTEIHFINDSAGFIVGEKGVFLKTTNRGLTWQKTIINESDNLNAIFALNNDTIFAGGDNLYKTTNGGQDWNILSNLIDIHEIKFLTREKGFIKSGYISECGYPPVYQHRMKYYQTTNGGNSWAVCNELPFNYNSGDIEITSGDTAYQFGNLSFWDFEGGCGSWSVNWTYKTINQGITWDEIFVFNYGQNIDVSFINSLEGFLMHTSDGIIRLYKINGGGEEFVLITDITENTVSKLVFATLNEGYYTSGGRIMKTVSGGIEWTEDYNNPSTISQLQITQNFEGYAIGNSGLILHKKINPYNEPIPWITTDNDQLNFPVCNINELITQNFILSASGTADLIIDITAPSNFLLKTENSEEFVSQITGLIIPPQHDTIITVAFNPHAYQWYHDTVSVTSNALNKPLIKLPVAGKGAYILSGIFEKDTSFCADSIWVDDFVTITEGNSMTICQGTVVVVSIFTDQEFDFNISGSFYAIGTPEDSICFVSSDDEHGWDGFGIFGDEQSESVILKYCVIRDVESNRYPDSDGGGLTIYGDKPVSILNSSIVNCRSGYGGGGGVFCSGSNCLIDSCKISNCYANYGGGIMTDCDTIIISNSLIYKCKANNNNGGGLYLYESSHAQIENCELIDCFAQQFGGGLYSQYSSGISVQNCTVKLNDAMGYGAGIALLSTTDFEITGCNFLSNKVWTGSGGAVYMSGSFSNIKNSLFQQNLAGLGAGIYLENSSSLIQNNRIVDNRDESGIGKGLGIYIDSNLGDQPVNIIQNLIYGNKSNLLDADGSGIYITNASVNVILNTISNNEAITGNSNGGGIYCSSESSDTVRIIGNIIFSNLRDQVYIPNNSAQPIVEYNDIQGGWNGGGPGNINDNPGYYAEWNELPDTIDNYYFVPAYDSPCIDAGPVGIEGIPVPEYDLAGNPRIAGEKLDMGVYENNFSYQPLDTGFCEGYDIQLEVIPIQDHFITFSWTFNGDTIQTGSSNILMIENPSDSDVGYYRCTPYGPETILYGRSVYLQNYGFAPVPVEQPVGNNLNAGDSYFLQFKVDSPDIFTDYQWYRNDSIIQDAIQWQLIISDFSKAQEGFYKCIATNPCGELVSNEALLLLNPSSIDDFTQQTVDIFPNPATNYITISTVRSAVSGQRSAVGVDILDLSGRKMMQFGPEITLPFVIDISGLEDGVYILKSTDEDGEMESRKFVKAGKH